MRLATTSALDASELIWIHQALARGYYICEPNRHGSKDLSLVGAGGSSTLPMEWSTWALKHRPCVAVPSPTIRATPHRPRNARQELSQSCSPHCPSQPSSRPETQPSASHVHPPPPPSSSSSPATIDPKKPPCRNHPPPHSRDHADSLSPHAPQPHWLAPLPQGLGLGERRRGKRNRAAQMSRRGNAGWCRLRFLLDWLQ